MLRGSSSLVATFVASLAACLSLASCQNANAVGDISPADNAYATAAQDTPPASTTMPAGFANDEIPLAFADFCGRFPDQCRARAGVPEEIALTAQTWRTMVSVNASVNRAIWPMSDQDHYKREDFWTIPKDGYGDCDDYAMTKRAQLIAAGLSERALRIALVVTPNGRKHAVLTVATDKGDYVLDNRVDAIEPWTQTGFTWLTRQDSGGAWGWVSFDPAKKSTADMAVAATRRPPMRGPL